MSERRQRPDHARIVRRTATIWIAVHLGLWLLLGLPAYASCLNRPHAPDDIFGCGADIGGVALAIGAVQLVYAVFAIIIVLRNARGRGEGRRLMVPRVQGIMIGAALVALLHTVLCFASLALPSR